MPDQQTARSPRSDPTRTGSGVLAVVVEQCLAPVPGGTGRYASEITAALAAGGRDNGAPGLRPQYHADYYGAFVIGPDGHNLEAVCHAPEAA